MATLIIAALVIGAAGYIIYKKVIKIKDGDFSCEGCKGGKPGCSTCPVYKEFKQTREDEGGDSGLDC